MSSCAYLSEGFPNNLTKGEPQPLLKPPIRPFQSEANNDHSSMLVRDVPLGKDFTFMTSKNLGKSENQTYPTRELMHFIQREA
ncbi:hypothetical protein QJS04_geneDACA015370 [Acorus gramineus]|uniref:Uncharacterized protein n=1 Tax=Acorus gramineus TaxID=55184 RepID=A0AAV9ASM4_ACOGR|nr:hypothetical protein QJS04_geneDACA015370 [Acorus gramineus]